MVSVEKICKEIDSVDFYFTGINIHQVPITYRITSSDNDIICQRQYTIGQKMETSSLSHYLFKSNKSNIINRSIDEQINEIKKFFADTICKKNGFSEETLMEIYM